MKKNEELANPNSCLNRAEEDEPIFVLRANDPLAPSVIRSWTILSVQNHLHTDKLTAAVQLAEKAEEWFQKKHEPSGIVIGQMTPGGPERGN